MTSKSKKRGQNREIAISVKGLSKSFRLAHQKIDSVRGAFVSMFAERTYEEFRALDDVSFDVYKGEFIGILGHNGSGKSTLLKCLAGVYTPDEGRVDVNGRISPFLELGIGFNPELSGRDNIYLNATILGLSKAEIDEKFDDIVEFSEIGRFIDQQVKNYSSGMKSRLAFAVSVHANREILLMDEVLAVGDARFKDKCMEHFENYKTTGKTVVLVTHSMGVVREHCDRAILLHEGKVIDVGEPDAVADHYIEVNLTEDQKRQIEKDEANKKSEERRKNELARKRDTQQRIAKKKRELEKRLKAQEQGKLKLEKQRKIEMQKHFFTIDGSKADFREIAKIDSFHVQILDKYVDITIDYSVLRFDHLRWHLGVSLYVKKEEKWIYLTGIDTIGSNFNVGNESKAKLQLEKDIFLNGLYRCEVGIFCEMNQGFAYGLNKSSDFELKNTYNQREKKWIISAPSKWINKNIS